MLDWVQDKLRRVRAEGWTRLDLGNAGLTVIPAEVWSLEGLEVLVLGDWFCDHQGRIWARSENQGPQNTIAVIPEQMARLSCLCELYLNGNRIVDVWPLATLTALTSLHLWHTQVRTFPHFLLDLPALRTLSLYRTSLQDVPPEILGTPVNDNCLDAVRAHFADKAQGVAFDREMKLILLGNGRVGKSSVVKRLVHDTFDPEEPSTHGIRLEPWTVTVNDGPIDFHIWDFGGQDIYHGTHALFLKSQALFLIVWDHDTEQQPGYSEEGLSFEHYPLQYWLDYVQHTSPDASVLVVENKCDNGRGKRHTRAPLGTLHRL